MWFPAVTTQAPVDAVVSVDEAKTYLRVDDDDQETEIADAIDDAVGHIEKYTGTRLLTQTVSIRAGSFSDLARLPIGPIQSIISITYMDTLGIVQTLDPSVYELFGADLERGIRPAFNQQWPTTRAVDDAIGVAAVVGYAADIPGPIRRAVKLLLGDFYASREDTVIQRSVTPATLPNGVESVLANFRINA